ncbi:MAG: InlB B-repeat-containing protein, partial [Conexivisphaera sp.]
MRFGARRRGVSTLVGGLIAIALFITVVFTITFFYSAALGGFLHEFQMTQTINYKNSEYLVVSYSFNSTLNTGNLTVTNGGKYPARVVEILKAPANGGPATLIPENVTIWPGQSHTFAGVLQQGYHYAAVTSYGNTWWSSFGVVNPVAGTYSLTIQIETIPGGDGGSTSPPPGTYYYGYGTEVTIGAQANRGYAFRGWVGQGGYSYTGTNATATIYTWDNMTETAVFVGQPQPVTFSEQGIPSSASVSPTLLTVSYNGTTYQFSPSQLPVTLQIPTGTTVTYAWATPVYDSTSGIRYLWVSTSGLVTGQTGSFMVPAGGGSVTATYSTQYELTVNIGQGLTVNVNPPNVSANTGQIQEWYSSGTQVTLSATGSSGNGWRYIFTSWTGSGSGSYSGTNNPATVTMNGPVTETANSQLQYYLNMQVNPSGAGSVAPGSGWYNAGVKVTISASPSNGYLFSSWSGSGSGSYSGTNNPATVTMNGPINETANFAYPTIKFQQAGLPSDARGTVLTLTYGGNTYTYTASQLPVTLSIPAGTSISFSWTSPVYNSAGNTRYLWGSTSDNFGVSLGQSGSFNMPAMFGATVTAFYGNAQGGGGIQYLLTMAVNPSGAGSTNPAVGTYWEPAGTALSIGATPNSGWAFISWTGTGSGSYSGTLQYPSITMNGPINETANFEPVITFSQSGVPSSVGATLLTVSYSGSTYTYSASQLPVSLVIPLGTTVSYSWASPVAVASGVQYTLTSVVYNGAQVGGSGSFTMNGPGSMTATYGGQYLVQTWPSPSAGGSTSPSSKWVSAGSSVTITATPNSGWAFQQWSGTIGSSTFSTSQNPYTLTATGPVNATAYFWPGLTVNATPGGYVVVSNVNTGQVLDTVSGGSSQTFYEPPGTEYSLQATADSGSAFTGWSGALSGTTNPATITVSAPESVQANFVTVQFNFLTAYDAIDPATGYNYWVASVGQVSGYSGPLQLTFYVTSTANGQTYTVSTTVNPNSRGWFYTGVLTISGGYGVWGHGVAAKEVVISIQTTGGQWIPVKTYSGWAWGVIITHTETYVGQLQNQIGGTMTISVPSWDGIVLYTIHDTDKTVLLPQQTTVQLSATPDSGYYFYQFELAQGSTYNQPSNPLWTSTSNPYQWTTPPSGTDAYSYGGYLTAEFRQTSLTFTVYSPMFTNVPFTLYLTGPNGQTSWSATTSWTLSGWLASNTWSGLPQGTYSWYISPTSYNGYPAVPQYGTIVLTSTATQVISYGGKLYTVTFQESGLPSGATWSVQFDGQNLSATAPNSIVFQGVPQGTYSWSAGPNPYYPGTNGVRYYSGAASGSLSVSGNTT